MKTFVPITADVSPARNEPSGHVQPGYGWQRGRKQASLQRRGRGSIELAGQRLDGQRRPVGGYLQQVHVITGKNSRAQRAHVQYAKHGIA